MKSLALLSALIVVGLPVTAQETGSIPVQRVLGIGGLFFRAHDPVSLAQWYEKHLGITRTPSSYDEQPWQQDAGPTVFAPFSDATTYFGARDRVWMVNFRVRDLSALAAQLRASGIAVNVDSASYPNGRFARLHDPEGNPIELWEPAGSNQARMVPGIGGLFFRARDPASLARWYERNLGITRTPSTYDEQPWRQEAGPTVFAPFPDATTHFGARDRAWMVNFRVRDLDAMVEQLRANGMTVTVDPATHPNGRFARLNDPEGNPIELWEAKAPGVRR